MPLAPCRAHALFRDYLLGPDPAHASAIFSFWEELNEVRLGLAGAFSARSSYLPFWWVSWLIPVFSASPWITRFPITRHMCCFRPRPRCNA